MHPARSDAIDTAGTHIWQAVQVGVVLSVVAFAVRFVWMWVLYKINQKKHHTNVSPLRLQEVLLMAWAGMRGLVTLAVVLASRRRRRATTTSSLSSR